MFVLRSSILLTGPVQSHLIDQSLATSDHSDSQRSRVFEGHIIWNTNGDICFDCNPFGKSSVFVLQLVGALCEATDPVTDFPLFRIAITRLHDDSSEVTPRKQSFLVVGVVDVLPVRRVERHCFHVHPNIARSWLGVRSVVFQGSFAWFSLLYNRFHG